jgi:hypothetical protein
MTKPSTLLLGAAVFVLFGIIIGLLSFTIPSLIWVSVILIIIGIIFLFYSAKGKYKESIEHEIKASTVGAIGLVILAVGIILGLFSLILPLLIWICMIFVIIGIILLLYAAFLRYKRMEKKEGKGMSRAYAAGLSGVILLIIGIIMGLLSLIFPPIIWLSILLIILAIILLVYSAGIRYGGLEGHLKAPSMGLASLIFIIIGIITAILSVFWFPMVWISVILIIIGIVLAFYSVMLERRETSYGHITSTVGLIGVILIIIGVIINIITHFYFPDSKWVGNSFIFWGVVIVVIGFFAYAVKQTGFSR